MPRATDSANRRRVTKSDVSLAMAALALLIAATGITPAEAAKAVKRALNADKVNGISASRTPTPGKLLPLGADGKLPAAVLPPGIRGPRGADGPAGPAGAPGVAGAAASPGGSQVLFRARAVAVQTTLDNGHYTVLFGGEDFDPSNVFDPGASRFVAPVSGYYAFAASVQLSFSSTPARSLLRLISNRENMTIRGTDLESPNSQQPTANGLMQLNKGDQVITVVYTSGVRTVQVAETTFAGWLVAPS